jgi:hypothetical protein
MTGCVVAQGIKTNEVFFPGSEFLPKVFTKVNVIGSEQFGGRPAAAQDRRIPIYDLLPSAFCLPGSPLLTYR